MHNLAIVTRKLPSHNRELQLEIWPNPGAGVMLFYPGTMLSPFQYRPMLHALRQAGFAVAALHLTGHGLNRHSTGFTFADLLQNGLDAENWLRQSGYSKIAVCGHSQGGIRSLAHAAASSGIVASFPITAVLPQMREAIYLTRFAALANRRQKIEAVFAALARWLPRLPLPLHAYLAPGRILAGARRTVTNRRKARFSYPLQFLASLFNTHLPTTMRCPVCMFSARNDALFTPAIIQATFDSLEAPAKKLIWLSGGGHLAAMNPPLCRFTARTAAAFCAGLGLPLRLESSQISPGDTPHGL